MRVEHEFSQRSAALDYAAKCGRYAPVRVNIWVEYRDGIYYVVIHNPHVAALSVQPA